MPIVEKPPQPAGRVTTQIVVDCLTARQQCPPFTECTVVKDGVVAGGKEGQIQGGRVRRCTFLSVATSYVNIGAGT